jgi:serine/threonine protein kinase
MASDRNLYPPQTRINDWTIRKHIGHGGYGEIYEVTKPSLSAPCAMKIELKSSRKRGLRDEAEFLTHLQGTSLFPLLVEADETDECNYLVLELLGPTISVVRRALVGQRYSPFTTTVLAREMLECIEELHHRGFLHRDIKPANFLFRNDDRHIICMIDFGLSRPVIDFQTRALLAPRPRPGFIGTCSFASINAHDGMELGRRDDIISWFYTIVEIAERKLPWPGSKDRDETYRLKREATAAGLCRSLPPQFIAIYEATLALGFADEPNYGEFYRLIDEALAQLGSGPFDWEMLDPAQSPFVSALPRSERGTAAPAREGDGEGAMSESGEGTRSTPVIHESRLEVDDRKSARETDERRDSKEKKKKKKKDDDEAVCHACDVV